MIHRILPIIPAICLLILFAYLDRLMRKVKPVAGEPVNIIKQARIALWGSWVCVLVSAIVFSLLEGK